MTEKKHFCYTTYDLYSAKYALICKIALQNKTSQRIIKVIIIHCEGNMNVCTICLITGNRSNSCHFTQNKCVNLLLALDKRKSGDHQSQY